MRPLDKVIGRLENVKEYTGYHKALCPIHEDREPSLSISEVGQNGDAKVLLKCHAGCEPKAILDSIGLEWSDLFSENGNGERNERKKKRQIVKLYDYLDLDGNIIHQTVRYAPKDFRQRRPDGNGSYIWSLKGIEPVLYRLPEVAMAVKEGRVVLVVEGEKDADIAWEKMGV